MPLGLTPQFMTKILWTGVRSAMALLQVLLFFLGTPGIAVSLQLISAIFGISLVLLSMVSHYYFKTGGKKSVNALTIADLALQFTLFLVLFEWPLLSIPALLLIGLQTKVIIDQRKENKLRAS